VTNSLDGATRQTSPFALDTTLWESVFTLWT